jgi:hypothetical protein
MQHCISGSFQKKTRGKRALASQLCRVRPRASTGRREESDREATRHVKHCTRKAENAFYGPLKRLPKRPSLQGLIRLIPGTVPSTTPSRCIEKFCSTLASISKGMKVFRASFLLDTRTHCNVLLCLLFCILIFELFVTVFDRFK